MTLNSINTNIAALRAQENIGAANRASSSSIARLSSGERIVRAADDVASVSAGTSLRTNVTTLRTALINTAQGSSLLQVADGALSEITDILLRQKAISVQAGSGSLTASERSFLNQEFQNLTQEIDRLADQTNFNGVTLLNGDLFARTDLVQSTDAARSADIELSLAANLANGDAFDINGITITAVTAGTVTDADVGTNNAAEFELGTTIAETLGNLRNLLSSEDNALLSGFTYDLDGSNTSLLITSRAGGDSSAESQLVIDDSAGTLFSVSGRVTNTASVFVLDGGNDDGISIGSVTASGTVGDSIVYNPNNETFSDQNVGAFATVSFQATENFGGVGTVAGTLSLDDGVGGTVDFAAQEPGTTPLTANQFAVQLEDDGTTIDVEATLDALVGAINNYSSTGNNDDFVLGQVEARREGLDIIIQRTTSGDILQTDFTTASTGVTQTVAFGTASITTALFDNGASNGINLTGVSNSAFVGNISGFEAVYDDPDTVTLSIDIGGRTYTASRVDISADNFTDLVGGTEALLTDDTPAVRFTSSEGDFFDIDIAGGATNANLSANDQSDADNIAARLDAAFAGLTFYQSRNISSFEGAGDFQVNGVTTGSLNGSSFELRSSDFSEANVQAVRVTAAPDSSSDARIEVDINGVTYRSTDLTDSLGPNSVYTLTSEENPEEQLVFRTGGTRVPAVSLTSADEAQAFEVALTSAFGIGEGGDTLNFQVGVTTADSLEISIGTVTTEALYSGQTLDVLTQDSAAIAGDQLDIAIDAVTAVRAEVGALQSRFDFASANIESSLQNQDSARAVLLDTDVAAESTAFATAQVQLQAGISVLAQANLLQQNLLKLIG